MSVTAYELKCRCASAYASGAARFLLGDTLHPGGAELTERLVDSLALSPRSTVIDVACGPGRSTVRAAARSGSLAIGIDLSSESLADARGHSAALGPASRAAFVRGDAESLPIGDGTVDGVLCECALCTFPDPAAAARELVRVLRPGGRLALSDVVADPPRLPERLRTLEAHVACVAGARTLADLVLLLEDAGVAVESAERHDDALTALVERIEGRLRLARLLEPARAADVSVGLELVKEARSALASGALGYATVIGDRP
ncbi:MAG: class I SAM-dependent methyltransferase [Candidatus Limnocylindria bacterium]